MKPIDRIMLSKLTFSPLIRPYVLPCADMAATAPDPWTIENIEKTLSDPSRWFFVALLGDEPIAFASYLAVLQSADLELIVVREDFRRRGVGHKLLVYSLGQLREIGIERCLLELRASNQSAQGLYEKTGFERLAVRKDMYAHPKEDGYLMGTVLNRPKQEEANA